MGEYEGRYTNAGAYDARHEDEYEDGRVGK